MSHELITSRRGLLATLRSSLPRDQFFAGLYILGCANGLGSAIIRSLQSGDWTGGLQNISAIVLLACLAGVVLLLRDRRDEIIGITDLVVAVPFLILVAFPFGEASWVAVS